MKKIVKQIPNILTVIRIIFSILGFFIVYYGCVETGVIIYAIAALTDLFDGMIARKLNAVSKLGIKLDQISDKIMAFLICGCFIIYKDYSILLIIGFEFLIIFTNVIFYLVHRKWPLSSKSGKVKTVSLFLTLLLGITKFIFPILKNVYYVFLVITLIFEVAAFISYIVYLIYENRSMKL